MPLTVSLFPRSASKCIRSVALVARLSMPFGRSCEARRSCAPLKQHVALIGIANLRQATVQFLRQCGPDLRAKSLSGFLSCNERLAGVHDLGCRLLVFRKNASRFFGSQISRSIHRGAFFIDFRQLDIEQCIDDTIGCIQRNFCGCFNDQCRFDINRLRCRRN
jgi:hypothetical protein